MLLRSCFVAVPIRAFRHWRVLFHIPVFSFAFAAGCNRFALARARRARPATNAGPLSGVIRDRLLKDAAHSGDAQRVATFFRGFLAAAAQTPASSAPQRTSRRAPSGPIYTRGQITQMATMRRRGQIGDKEWARWEHELITAGRDGRIAGALSLDDGIPRSR